MAKHKKPKPPEPEAPKEGEQTPAPPTESAAPEEPGKAPKETLNEIAERSRKLNTLFWLRVILAASAGTAATFIFEGIRGEELRWTSIVFMIAVFLASIIVAKSMNLRLPSSDRKKIVTQGIGSYIGIYLFMWITSYTIVNLSSKGGGITTPFG